MPDLMQAADLVVTKAGPSTICEAIACKLPLFLSGYIPGQEEGNVAYVCEQGVGLLVETLEELIATFRGCLQSHSPLLEQIRANMIALQNPNATLDIAAQILTYLGKGCNANHRQTEMPISYA